MPNLTPSVRLNNTSNSFISFAPREPAINPQKQSVIKSTNTNATFKQAASVINPGKMVAFELRQPEVSKHKLTKVSINTDPIPYQYESTFKAMNELAALNVNDYTEVSYNKELQSNIKRKMFNLIKEVTSDVSGSNEQKNYLKFYNRVDIKKILQECLEVYKKILSTGPIFDSNYNIKNPVLDSIAEDMYNDFYDENNAASPGVEYYSHFLVRNDRSFDSRFNESSVLHILFPEQSKKDYEILLNKMYNIFRHSNLIKNYILDLEINVDAAKQLKKYFYRLVNHSSILLELNGRLPSDDHKRVMSEVAMASAIADLVSDKELAKKYLDFKPSEHSDKEQFRLTNDVLEVVLNDYIQEVPAYYYVPSKKQKAYIKKIFDMNFRIYEK